MEGADFIDDNEPDAEDYKMPNNSSFDEFHQELAYDGCGYPPHKGHIRDALINSALDEMLTCNIFNCISNSNSHYMFPLEHLLLHLSRGGEFGGIISIDVSDLEQAIKSLSGEWLLTRSPKDDFQNKLIVTEIDKRLREEYKGRKLNYMNVAAWSRVEPVFRRIWPQKVNGSGDWHEDWYS